jgi:hypothetical protein
VNQTWPATSRPKVNSEPINSSRWGQGWQDVIDKGKNPEECCAQHLSGTLAGKRTRQGLGAAGD